MVEPAYTGLSPRLSTGARIFLDEAVPSGLYYISPQTVQRHYSDKELRYHVICKNGCMWRLNAQKRQSDGKWRISKVVEPHTCLTNRGKENHQQLTARYPAHRILGLIDDNNDISVSLSQ